MPGPTASRRPADIDLRLHELERKARASDVALIEMLDEKKTLTSTVASLTAQKGKLEGLCRALRAAGGQTENLPPGSDAVAKNPAVGVGAAA